MAKDIIHNSVRNALIKDGWTITHDPYSIEYHEVTVWADLGAERPIAAEREGQKIVVEIKSFRGLSPVRELETALGQYQLYAGFLSEISPERSLYLAVSDKIYQEFFTKKAIQFIITRYQIKMIVINLNQEEVTLWKS